VAPLRHADRISNVRFRSRIVYASGIESNAQRAQGNWRYYHPNPDSSTIDVCANKIRVGNGECRVVSVDGTPDLTTIVDETCEDRDESTGKEVKVRELYKLRNLNGLEFLIVATASSSRTPAGPAGGGFQPKQH